MFHHLSVCKGFSEITFDDRAKTISGISPLSTQYKCNIIIMYVTACKHSSWCR
jgi:hypothetical protein